MSINLDDNNVEINNNANLLPATLNANITADLTDSLNKLTTDVIETKNEFIEPFKKGANFLGKFFVSKIMPPMYKSIEECKYKLRDIDKELEKKYNSIPQENRIAPRSSIVGLSLEAVKFNINEENIRQMFINILASEMDDRKQNKVLPAYCEILKGLSSDDAKFLLLLKKYRLSYKTIIIIKYGKRSRYNEFSRHILINIDNEKYELIRHNSLIIDNLKRLGIIETDSTSFYNYNEKLCKDAFNEIKKNIIVKNPDENKELFYSTEILAITDFGQNFINICCP